MSTNFWTLISELCSFWTKGVVSRGFFKIIFTAQFCFRKLRVYFYLRRRNKREGRSDCLVDFSIICVHINSSQKQKQPSVDISKSDLSKTFCYLYLWNKYLSNGMHMMQGLAWLRASQHDLVIDESQLEVQWHRN